MKLVLSFLLCADLLSEFVVMGKKKKKKRFNTYAPLYLVSLWFHLVISCTPSFTFVSNWCLLLGEGLSSVITHLSCTVEAGASTVFKNNFAFPFGEMKIKEKQTVHPCGLVSGFVF